MDSTEIEKQAAQHHENVHGEDVTLTQPINHPKVGTPNLCPSLRSLLTRFVALAAFRQARGASKSLSYGV